MASQIFFRVAFLHLLLAFLSMFHPYIPHFEYYFAIFAIYVSGKDDIRWIGLFFSLNLISFAFNIYVVVTYWGSIFAKTSDTDMWQSMNQVGFAGYAACLVTKLIMEFLAIRLNSANSGTIGSLFMSLFIPPKDVGQKDFVRREEKPVAVQSDDYQP